MGPFHALLMRCVFGICIQLVWLNRNLKKAVWDDINRTNSGPLIIRSGQGAVSNIINTAVSKFLPLTMISVVNNLGPPITIFAAYFFLKEKLKMFELIMVVLTIAAVFVFIFGGEP